MSKAGTTVLGAALGVYMGILTTANAQWNDSPGAHFTDYALIDSANSTNLVGGIRSGVAYMCFVVTNFPNLTETQAEISTNTGNTASWKQIVYAFNSHVVDDYEALASTNRTTKMIPNETIQGGATANVTINHGIQTVKSIDGSTVVAE
jgi:hypothetical protein